MTIMTAYLNYFIVSFFHALDTVYGTINKSIRQHRAYEELNRLTDYELRDLGLSRNDIPRVVMDSIKTQSFR